jgi:hypothetical protein
VPEPPHRSRSALVKSVVLRNACGSKGRRLWRTPAAGAPSPAVCRTGCAAPSGTWFAPPHAGFNDHHVCEKLCEVECFSLSGEPLRRLLWEAGLGSPRQRRAPAHRQRRLRSARAGELVQLDGSPHGSKAVAPAYRSGPAR